MVGPPKPGRKKRAGEGEGQGEGEGEGARERSCFTKLPIQYAGANALGWGAVPRLSSTLAKERE